MWKHVKKSVFILFGILIFAATFIGVCKIANINGINDNTVNSVSDNDIADNEKESSDAMNDATQSDEVCQSDDNIDELAETVDSENVTGVSTNSVVASSENAFDKNDWKLLLVNKQHPIPDGYEFELAVISGDKQCDARILDPLNEMFEAAKEEDIYLVVCSPYRETSRQVWLFDRKMKGYINSGYSYIDAYKESSAVVTVPGTSEHEVGLSLDIISNTYSKLDEKFGSTDAGKWLKNNAHKYGFILRYPKGKENITGIIYEPWHYRYVGIDAATVIYEKNITLEEFIESIS